MNMHSLIFNNEDVSSNSTNGNHATGGHKGHDKSSDVIFFIFSSLCLGGIVKEINKKTAVIFLFYKKFMFFRYHTPQCFL